MVSLTETYIVSLQYIVGEKMHREGDYFHKVEQREGGRERRRTNGANSNENADSLINEFRK